MLFRKNVQRSCAYCSHGTKVSEDQILCKKNGVVSYVYSCRRFRYDPCKRSPVKAKAMDFLKYMDEDFSL